ncbi:MAG: hypothetical protein ABJA81_08145 [Nocardioidaceae bacterium]
MRRRIATLSETPHTVPLAEALERLGKLAHGISSTGEPSAKPSVPDWLVHVLTNVVRMPPDQVERLTEEQAKQIWETYTRTPRP